MDSALRPRDIQARIRAGETPEAVAEAAQTTVDKIMTYAGPVLAEREHVAERAQRSSVRRAPGESAGGARTLGDAVAAHLRSGNVDPATVAWDAWRREDGRWSLTAPFESSERQRHRRVHLRRPGQLRRPRQRRRALAGRRGRRRRRAGTGDDLRAGPPAPAVRRTRGRAAARRRRHRAGFPGRAREPRCRGAGGGLPRRLAGLRRPRSARGGRRGGRRRTTRTPTINDRPPAGAEEARPRLGAELGRDHVRRRRPVIRAFLGAAQAAVTCKYAPVMSYFVTGATGFIGRHLVQELVDHREGDIFVLVRAGSMARIDALDQALGLGPGQPVVGDLAERRARRRPRVGGRARREDRPLLPPRRDLRHDRRRRHQRAAERRRHPPRPPAGRAAEGRLLPPGLVGRGRGRVPRPLRRDDVRRGPAPALAVPPHEVRVGEDRARPRRPCPWRVYRPAIVVGDSADRRDGQDRRALLLLPAPQAAARQPARVAAAGRRRPRRHQRGAGRLRRQGDGPPRPPARPRRRGVPPGQPGAAVHGRDDQRLLRRGGCAPLRHAGRPQRDQRRAARAGAATVPRVRARQRGWSRSAPVQALLDQTLGRLGIPAEVLAHTGFRPVFDSRITEKALAGLGDRGARPGDLRPHAVGLLGGEPRHVHRPRTRRTGPRSRASTS